MAGGFYSIAKAAVLQRLDSELAQLELLRDVWGFRSATVRTRTLDSHACRLRRKLQPGEFVVNVWGVGYKLVEAEAEAVCLSGA